jgi:hypothetical protein
MWWVELVMVAMKGAKIINLHNSIVGEGNHFRLLMSIAGDGDIMCLRS